MAKPKKPVPVFEVLFEGPGIYPEQIPLGTLTQTLSAIRRLATGSEGSEEDEEQGIPDDGAIRLLDVVRGSAVFRFVGQSPQTALTYLRLVGKVLNNPEEVGENDYLLRPLERLSMTARRLECAIVVREAGGGDAVLAKIERDSYAMVAKRLFVAGETALTGTVVRVGGATEMRCALRVPFQNRLLFCRVANADVARRLGDLLYQEVAVQGTAQWVKNNWRIVSFTVNGVYRPGGGSLSQTLEALRRAGGAGWDQVDDPEAYLAEVSGK